MKPVAASISAVLCLLALATAGASAPPASAGASGRAFAIKVAVPGEGGASTTVVSAPPDSSTPGAGFAYPADGSIVSAGSTSAGAAARATTSAASTAWSEVTGLRLFNGEITADAVIGHVKASAARGTSAADTSGSGVSNLIVLGQAAAGGRIALGDWGYATVLAEAVVRDDTAGARGSRGFVTALDIHLTADHGGLPAGSEILVGYAEAAAQASAAAPPSPGANAKSAKPSGPAPPRVRGGPTIVTDKPEKGKVNPLEPKRRAPGIPPPLIRQPPPDVLPKLTAGGYVFPVYGPAAFTNTFGAPRAVVGWHHGEDIFAPLGAPILAVADGTIFSVGWNDIGGYRLWLRDGQGNQFYYAHLSAYSPLAVNGRRVKAGDVVGFVGNTGDAESTPYHLHFEIHPVGLLGLGYDGAVSAYPYLVAWERLQDISFAAARGWAPLAPSRARAPQAGAILLQMTDISSASGLEPGSLKRALTAPIEAEGDGALLRSSESPITG